VGTTCIGIQRLAGLVDSRSDNEVADGAAGPCAIGPCAPEGGEREAEQVALFDGAAHPGVFWVKNLLPDPVSPCRSAGQHVDRACIDEVVDDLERYADGQVGPRIRMDMINNSKYA
jgi:hypothetical protein